ncbi:MAG: mechanosensitive ion channel family protein, partial [Candidatus Eremiobacterota bacterium]
PEPCPFVLQTGLNDFYVSYELNAYTREVNSIAVIYSELHQNIQDKFIEGGVEILSPHYSALRDGNQVTIPSNYVSEDYITPEFRIPRQVIFRNFQTEKNSEEAEMKSVED